MTNTIIHNNISKRKETDEKTRKTGKEKYNPSHIIFFYYEFYYEFLNGECMYDLYDLYYRIFDDCIFACSSFFTFLHASG